MVRRDAIELSLLVLKPPHPATRPARGSEGVGSGSCFTRHECATINKASATTAITSTGTIGRSKLVRLPEASNAPITPEILEMKKNALATSPITVKEIAARLHISAKTERNHVANFLFTAPCKKLASLARRALTSQLYSCQRLKAEDSLLEKDEPFRARL